MNEQGNEQSPADDKGDPTSDSNTDDEACGHGRLVAIHRRRVVCFVPICALAFGHVASKSAVALLAHVELSVAARDFAVKTHRAARGIWDHAGARQRASRSRVALLSGIQFPIPADLFPKDNLGWFLLCV